LSERTTSLRRRRRIAWLAATALAALGCTQPEPPPKPAPPPPSLPPAVTVAPEESLSMKGVYQPIAGGKYGVAIFVNGQRVIDGWLSKAKRRDHFHGQYNGHDIGAECALVDKVDCVIVVDGAPQPVADPGNEPVE
jgi:hypothetical protein